MNLKRASIPKRRPLLGSRERGSGIGLSLVQLVMEAHRGRATVADHPGGGTVFRLSLPKGPQRLEKTAPADQRRDPPILGTPTADTEKTG